MGFRHWSALFFLVCCLCVINVQRGSLIRSRNSAKWHPRSRSKVCVPRDCQLPDCYCAGKTGPSHLKNYQIPQMVMMTFDDAVNERVYEFYERLLTKKRLNPNGCPISLTFYLSHNWTDYELVKDLYRSGHEIASHSITHRMPQSWWTHASLKDWQREIGGQRRNIVTKAHVPRSEVKGMRVPFLELGGEKAVQDDGRSRLPVRLVVHDRPVRRRWSLAVHVGLSA
ncbi:hypothetical protein LSH36_1385g00016 [Paralvinella palmiformis]|uniref:NodB homology domain-containing protein n=1 Tax=Paralvinella palmiformis TaxID=53620 RepID=A0AAD9ITC6_9ANNE|nr:hypothetical protein LSH36_1385g00016 [Paralvinella palmiformis]